MTTFLSTLQKASALRPPISSMSSSSTNELIFGVIADVQWADADDGYNYGRTVKRCFRGSLRTLDRAVDWWNNLPSTLSANMKENAFTQTKTNTNTPLHYIAQL
eukprot:CAMPEP_0194413074 /NCGR_PEP_ID=MMETSP0176-20130528/11570_1 /TAXON_ID=216777 /ORGANISM="Proboscia alata, Strain PI-D3" /LENGTH=103 /DNA_ID=CAMNT_0039216197 /DNA_START=9 /DNA_END=316 /DNA_ORIENTATION=-